MAATNWSTRIPAAIADGERRLDGDEYVLIPPHIGGNETKLTLVLTAGEVALAKQSWSDWKAWNTMRHRSDSPLRGDEPVPLALIAFCTKIERLVQ